MSSDTALPVFVAVVFAATAFGGYGLFSWFYGHVDTPSELIHKAVVINARYMAEMEQCLRHSGVCDQVKKTGSTDDELNIDDEIEFQVLMIQAISEVDIVVEKIDYMHDYALLRYLHGRRSSRAFNQVLGDILGSSIGTRYLDTELTADHLKRELQKCITNSNQLNGKVFLVRDGSVLQMEVYPNSWFLSWGSRLYSVDVVAAYKIREELYVSRPAEGDKIPDTMTWHRSFALQERQILMCEGAKMVLRVLKVLHKREADFGNFTFYQLKTVVLHEIADNKTWSEVMFWKRLADVIARLEKFLTEGNLPHFFLPQINLLSNVSRDTIDHLCNRIQSFPTDENGLRRFLQT